jgi:hypothetical protein
MSTTRVLAGLVSNGNILADGTITPGEIGAAPASSVITITGLTYPGDDQAANPAGGQTITINGTGFASTPTVYVNGVIAPSVSFISSTQITFTSPARSAGTYDVYVVNPNGATAIRVYGISYSGTPTWTTGAGELGPVDANFSIQLIATGDAPMTYALTSGSTLPSGVTLSSAGLITGTALTVDQTFNFSVDAIDGQLQETPRSFFVTVSLGDPYFEYVSLLLNADPPVLPFTYDASTVNNNVFINGDVKSDRSTPYQGVGYYSIAMDGSGDYLTTGTTADFDLTGDFTVECWVNPSSSGNNTILSVGTPRGVYNYVISLDSTNTVTWSLNSASTWNVSNSYTTTDTVQNGVWTHLAFVKNGTNFSIYFNGVNKFSTNSYTQPSAATGTVYLGTYFANTNNDGSFFRGYISNFRLVKGTAVYTTAFTPPTTPLTAITNTKFLVGQNNRFVDNSTNNAALTLVGDTKIHGNQPFTLSSTLANYGSAYFDGSGDYLSIPSNTSFQVGSGDFTVECWAYMNAASQQFLLGQWNSPNRSWVLLVKNSGTTLSFTYSTTGSNEIQVDGTIASQPGRWAHFAAVRNGNTLTTYMNGVAVATASVSGVSLYSATQAIEIGRNPEATSTWNFSGYMTDARVVKGTAVYTSAFTPPTAPLTAITNTSLLTAQYNGGSDNSEFRDSSQNNFLITRNGNATQGTFTPYGSNWSNYFDGSGDYLTFPNNTVFNFSTGDFTVECWLYRTGTGSGTNIYESLIGGNESTPNYWNLYVNSSNNTIVWYGNDNTLRSTSNTITNNFWNHVAVSRSGSTLKIFINGVQGYSATVTTSYSLGSAGGRIGYDGPSTSTGNKYFNGYISNARVVKGTAVYTSNFTPSATPLTAITNTALLTCADNRFIDDSTNNFAITKNGDVSVQRFNPFNPPAAYSTSLIGGSAYFDGSGDYLTTADNPAFDFGSGNFTIEFWFYPTTTGSNGGLINKRGANVNYSPFLIQFNSSTILFGVSTSGSSWAALGTSGAVAINAWHHVALVRNGTSITGYVDGVSAMTGTATGAVMTNTSGIAIGQDQSNSGGNCFVGYVSDMRLTKGTALYTSSFTLPTTPLSPTTNTNFLSSFSNAGVIDSAMINDLETVGNAQISTSVKKYGTGSLTMLSSGDYLKSIQTGTVGDINGSDFTIEFWVNFTSLTADRALISKYGNSAENAGGLGYVLQWVQSSSVLRLVLGVGGGNDALYTFAWSPSISTWYHVAITRSGTSARAFVNGTQIGSTTTISTSDVASPNPVQIGKTHTTAQYLLGYMDDVRITKGYARYTANFTPPTSSLKNK